MSPTQCCQASRGNYAGNFAQQFSGIPLFSMRVTASDRSCVRSSTSEVIVRVPTRTTGWMFMFTALPLTACVMPDATPPSHIASHVAIARVDEGDSLTAIADRLSFPGGWRALAAANDLRGEFVRAGAGLRVPVDYIWRAGLDPFSDFGLEPLPQRAMPRTLVPCATTALHGSCVGNDEFSACLEDAPPDEPFGDPDGSDAEAADDLVVNWDESRDRDESRDQADGAMHYPHRDSVRIVVSRAGVEVERIVLPNGLLTYELDAALADLDGDGRPELVIAAPTLVWNHEGWDFARVFVVGADGMAQAQVAEWGAGSLITAADGQGCELLATTWEELQHPYDPTGGVYLVGRPMRYAKGALVADAVEVVRRFRRAFYLRDEGEPARPSDWLSEPEAEWWPELAEARNCTPHPGTIAAARQVPGGVVLTLDLDDGTVIDAGPDLGTEVGHGVARGIPLERIGSLSTGMLFPIAYVPEDVNTWRGVRTRVDTCPVSGDQQYAVAWL